MSALPDDHPRIMQRGMSREEFENMTTDVREVEIEGDKVLMGTCKETGGTLVQMPTYNPTAGAHFWLNKQLLHLERDGKDLRIILVCHFDKKNDVWCVATVCLTDTPDVFEVDIWIQSKHEKESLRCLAYSGKDLKLTMKKQLGLAKDDRVLTHTSRAKNEKGQLRRISLAMSENLFKTLDKKAMIAEHFFCKTFMAHEFWGEREWVRLKKIYTVCFEVREKIGTCFIITPYVDPERFVDLNPIKLHLFGKPLDNKHIDYVCNVCKISKTKLLTCARCKLVWYCGTDCQRADWPLHKLVCRKK